MSDTPRVDSDNRSYPRPEYAEEIVFEGSRHVVISPEAYEELYEIAPQLTRELTAANERIKRLVQAGDCLLSHRNSTDYHEKVREWDKAKKDKP